MLKSLELNNFQSHLHSKLDFANGVTVIVGPSRNGKTATLRALKWLVENRPIGTDGLVSHRQKEVSVTLELDGHLITRKKNSKENIYIIDGEKFAGFGTEVPLPVSQLLNLSELNIANQFDPPFLLFESPGQIAKVLNRVVHLEKIDTALANAESAKRQNATDIRNQESRIAELEAMEASFPDLEAAEDLIKELEDEQTSKRELEQRLGWIQAIQNDLRPLRKSLDRIKLPEGIENLVFDLTGQNLHLQQLRYTASLLRKLQDDLNDWKGALIKAGTDASWDGWITELLSKQKHLQDKRNLLSKLQFLQGRIAQEKTALNQKTAIILEMEAEFKEKMPDICPLCERIME